MDSLEDLVRQDRIQFYSCGRKLDTQIDDFGEFDQDLAMHLAGHSGKYMTITGDGLQDYLKEPANLCHLAGFLVQMWFGEKDYHFDGGMSFHVDVNIHSFYDHYIQPGEEPLINGLGREICDCHDWVPEIPYLEKMWTFALCGAIGGMVGYPGYEHPRSDSGFRHEMRHHAQSFMIGTKDQLARYREHARHYSDAAIRDLLVLVKDSEMMFDDTWSLMTISQNLDSARRIAENIGHFQACYESL